MDPTTLAEGLRDIKGPVSFPTNHFFLTCVLAIACLAALIFLIIFFLKKYLKRKAQSPAIPIEPADKIAYKALERLKAKDLPRFGKIKEYYIELSDIVRRYMENRFSFRAPEMTTEEFLYFLRESDSLSGAHKNSLKQFLNHCDLVKFAKYGPTGHEIDDSFNFATKLVDETKLVAEKEKKVTLK